MYIKLIIIIIQNMVGVRLQREARIAKVSSFDVIEQLVPGWCASPVLVRKRDSSVRLCIDYLALNNVTKTDVFLYQ